MQKFKPEDNPYTTAFGMVPYQYIEDEDIVNEIIMRVHSRYVTENCFMLTGIRGSGKTVTMTDIEKKLEDDSDFVVVSLSSTDDILRSLVSRLHDSYRFIKDFINTELNLSLFGIGIAATNIAPSSDLESALMKILDKIKKDGKKLLITIDEVSKNDPMVSFAKTFNLLSRKEYPVYLLMTGLVENITSLENEKDLTFLRRAHKYEMKPLNITLMRQKYMDTFNVDMDTAYNMAGITKGYPVAYQALGQHLWESGNPVLTDAVLQKFDDTLDVKVYSSIWKSLLENERMYLCYLSEKDGMPVAELLEKSGKKASDFSPYREKLIESKILASPARGIISFALPRFDFFVKQRIKIENRTPENNYKW